jgi:molecular chaperone GrpE
VSGRRIDVKGEDPEDETRSSRDEADASAERAQRAPGERSSSEASAERAQRAPARDPLAGGERSSAGWESLAEESQGSLAPSAELEEALREAAEAVEERGRARARERSDPPSPSQRESELVAELEATKDRHLRLHADFENFRRRATRERLEAEQYGHQNLVKDLLTAVDNLDRAIDHARRSDGGDLDSLLQGVELVRRELVAAMVKHGVAAIDAAGQPFDPALHEAMAQAPDDSVAPNTVIEELQRGYVLRDRLLRPARVIVSRRSED